MTQMLPGHFQPMGLILPIDKPAGLTSFGVVSRVKRLLPRGTKIGHAGTLDPFATGLLLLLIGKATKQCETMMDQPKQYETTIRFGASSTTDDLTGEIAETANATTPSLHSIQEKLTAMTGEISQRPPIYSAIKISGPPRLRSSSQWPGPCSSKRGLSKFMQSSCSATSGQNCGCESIADAARTFAQSPAIWASHSGSADI